MPSKKTVMTIDNAEDTQHIDIHYPLRYKEMDGKINGTIPCIQEGSNTGSNIITGIAQTSVPAGSYAFITVDLTDKNIYAVKPVVVATLRSTNLSGALTLYINSISTTRVVFCVHNNLSIVASPDIHYMIIG